MARMKSLGRRLLLAAASGLLSTTMAQVCTPEPRHGYDYSYYVASQSTLDTLASECTSINGSIRIPYNYTGSFYLPNIQRISGNFQWYPKESQGYTSHYVTSPVDSISIPDLERIDGSLELQYLYDLRNISLPKLRTIGDSVYVRHAYDVDLRSLQGAEFVYIYGNLSSIRLDSLEEVHEIIKICNKDGCSDSRSPASSLEVFLLSLKSAGHMELDGRISTLALPKLTSLNGADLTDVFEVETFELTTYGGPPLNLSFPLLDTVSANMKLAGNIGSISMPKMIDTNITLQVDASSPLAIDLPIQRIRQLELRGNISSVALPNLRNATDGIYIYSDMSLDCEEIESDVFPHVRIWNGSKTCSATSPAKSKSHGLSTSAKVGIGVGCGLPGVLALGLIKLYFDRRSRNKQVKTVSEVELTPPSYQAAQQDRPSPPEYTPGDTGHGAGSRET